MEPGTQLGPYEIKEPLGKGGMGEVFRASDTRLRRDVALKVLPTGLADDPARRRRFEQEAHTVSRLNHPNICVLHDIGRDQGIDYLVMELLEGETLAERLRRGPMPPDEVLRIAVQVAEALDAAHGEGVIHRDIKPANIFITAEDRVKILDFGLAKLEPAEERGGRNDVTSARTEMDPGQLTGPGAALGTVAYMSPEQARGEQLDPRTDLFSFGAVLYEMITGQRAFSGATSAVVHDAILNRDPSAPTRVNPAVPAGLEEIVDKALEKDREVRYQSAAELRADLLRLQRDSDASRVATGGATGAAGPSGAARGSDPSGIEAHWRSAVAGAVVLALAVTAWVVATRTGWLGSEPSATAPSVSYRQLTSNPAENPVWRAVISPDGRYLAYTDLEGLHLRTVDGAETQFIPAPEGSCFR